MEKIASILSKRLDKLLKLDGGTVEVVQYNPQNQSIKIRLAGTYMGCPCRDTIVKYVIMPILKNEIENLETVEWID